MQLAPVTWPQTMENHGICTATLTMWKLARNQQPFSSRYVSGLQCKDNRPASINVYQNASMTIHQRQHHIGNRGTCEKLSLQHLKQNISSYTVHHSIFEFEMFLSNYAQS